ncbi:FMN-binding protein [candidate division WOR-3 bacterium]|nr:FMN-binding protein [candidate division WOR-3 bacterium]
MKNKVKSVSVLFIISVVSAFSLSFVYEKTKPIIEEGAKKQIEEALVEVFGDSTVQFETVKSDTLWKAYRGDTCVGIVYRYAKKGYSGTIRPIVGVDSTGRIIKVKFPKEGLTETPGLGMKITEEWFQEQFSGLCEDGIWLKKDKDSGKIDAITAATISSRAATSAIREGLTKYKTYLSGDLIKECKWYTDDIERLSGEKDLEEVIDDRLWKSGEQWLYLFYGEGFVSSVGVVVSVINDTIQGIHIQTPEEGMEETPGCGTMIADAAFEEKFIGVYINEIDELDHVSGATVSSDAVKKAIKEGYKELVKRSEK